MKNVHHSQPQKKCDGADDDDDDFYFEMYVPQPHMVLNEAEFGLCLW